MRRVLVTLVALGATAACGRVGEPEKMIAATGQVSLEGCESAGVLIDMPGGQLQVSRARAALVAGSFRFDQEQMRPVIEGSRDGARSEVVLSAPGYEEGIGRTFNEWSLELSDECPTDLTLRMKIGRADLDLEGVPVKTLDLNLGGGELLVDLGRSRPRADVSGSLEMGHGKILLTLPAGVGIRVRAWKSVGTMEIRGLSQEPESEESYVNDRFGKAEVNIDLTARVGFGDLEVIARE